MMLNRSMYRVAMITGVTGQDGSFLADNLVTKGYKVIGLKRWTSSDNTGRILELEGERMFETRYWDAADPAQVTRTIIEYSPDVIFNMAAPSFVGNSFHTPSSVMDDITKPLINICESIITLKRERNVKVYQASSSEIFGDQDQLLTMDGPKVPVSPYGIAKLAAHNLASYYRKRGLMVSSGILFNHESPRRGENFLSKKVIRGLCEIALCLPGREKITIWDETPFRDWGLAQEYMDIVVNYMESKLGGTRDFMVATGESISVKHFCIKTFNYLRNLGYFPDTESYSDVVQLDQTGARPTDIRHMIVDNKDLERNGRVANFKVDDVIQHMVDYELYNIKEKYQI